MSYQIDQSGKIEQTNKDTVLAIANGKTFSILLKAGDKRLLQEIFRTVIGKRRQYIYEVFSALLYILISSINPKGRIVIDKEYPGHESLIKLNLVNFYGDSDKEIISNIEFNLIGKLSSAHDIASKVFQKKTKPSKTVTIKEIKDLIFPQKKIGYSGINGTEGS